MTMFYDDEIDKIFQRMSASFFNMGDIEDSKSPYFYGRTITVGPDGKPVVKEYGNRSRLSTDAREPLVDVITDEKENLIKLVAEMPGVEKSDVKITVQNRIVEISADNGNKKYHAKVPIQHKIDENSAKATYKNGILELTFKLVGVDGKRVEVN